MNNNPFRFKQFVIEDDKSSMKVGTDAVLLGSWVKPPLSGKILDIGTGSGVIALMMAQRTQAFITAIDVHAPSIAQAERNFMNSPWSKRLRAINTSLENFTDSYHEKFDFLVSNPPFFINSLKPQKDILTLAKHTDEPFIDGFISGLHRLSSPSGKIALILPAQLCNVIKQKFETLSIFPARITEVYSRTGSRVSRVMFEFAKNTEANCTYESIYVHQGKKGYTNEYIKLTEDFYLFPTEQE